MTAAPRWFAGSAVPRWFAAARAAYGSGLLCAPGRAIRLADGAQPDRIARAVARVLGARHLAQACVTAFRPCPVVLVLGAGTDIAHAVSMLASAAVGRRTRAALTDAAAATAFGAAGLVIARSASSQRRTVPGHGRNARGARYRRPWRAARGSSPLRGLSGVTPHTARGPRQPWPARDRAPAGHWQRSGRCR